MKIVIITASPNASGLTATCGESAMQGAKLEGAEVTLVSLNEKNIGRCQCCNNGFGTCRDSHGCQVADDFPAIHNVLKAADGYIIVTPVYWGEMSETAKTFIDRLRRCEAYKTNNELNQLEGKPMVCVAAAGGTGNGCISCLASMERFVDHVKGIKFDFIGVTRRNREYKLEAIRDAAKGLVRSIRDKH